MKNQNIKSTSTKIKKNISSIPKDSFNNNSGKNNNWKALKILEMGTYF